MDAFLFLTLAAWACSVVLVMLYLSASLRASAQRRRADVFHGKLEEAYRSMSGSPELSARLEYLVEHCDFVTLSRDKDENTSLWVRFVDESGAEVTKVFRDGHAIDLLGKAVDYLDDHGDDCSCGKCCEDDGE